MEKMQYAGFGRRLSSMLVDSGVFLPLMGISFFVEYKSLYTYVLISIISLLIGLLYEILLLKNYGATLGKMVAKIKVVKLDGSGLGWKEVILRTFIGGVLSFFISFIYIRVAYENQSIFGLYSYWDSTKKLAEVVKANYSFYLTLVSCLNQLWFWSELIIMLFNKKKRALHDFIAGTVVIKT
jgi:uncharacterized RDD family membrane protein YckC